MWVKCGHMICLRELWPILSTIFVSVSADRRPDWPCDGGHHSCVKNAGGTGALPTWDTTLVKTLGQYPGGQGHTLMPGLETTVYHTLVHCGVLW